MNIKLAGAVALAFAVPSISLAQQALVLGQQAVPTLRMGTEVAVRTRTELTTQKKALRVGQRFEVETTEPVMVNGQVVVPVGTPGWGEVTSVSNKGMWGKSGHFDVRLLYLRVGDRQIKLTGVADDKGRAGGVGAAAVSAIVFLPAGFFMTGTSARLPAGTIIKGSIDENVPLQFAGNTAPAPMTVPVSASAGAVPNAVAPASTAIKPAQAPVVTPAAHIMPAVATKPTA